MTSFPLTEDHISVLVDETQTYLTLQLADAAYRFHAVWLRDNALDGATRSSENGQRLITLLDQPAAPSIQSANVIGLQTLKVEFAHDETEYLFPLAWLMRHRYDNRDNDKNRENAGWLPQTTQLWGSEQQSDLPAADYTNLMNDAAVLRDWLSAVQAYGFAIVKGLPDELDALLSVVSRFGFVRETNYGKVFEVRAEINPSNLAFTGLGLQAHTDNPYRDPVPTLQVLSCIENTVEGGESILIDGFSVAKTLQQENERHFELLSQYSANFCYAGESETDLRSRRPMIELNADGELIAVRFNNRSAAPFTQIPFNVMSDYYAAYRHFAEIVERQDKAICFKLAAGELFIVDNTRVMHSRTAFSTGGQRWLRGCYADKDGLNSTLNVLNQSR